MADQDDIQAIPAESPPDIMNDPEYATNTGDGEDNMGDVDTCRICRGEGSDSEPLFHPCKCSGSIKYVHQDCLMEWLSHSQKKHCELCKTPFRFTKLYSPNMPQSLPLHILLRHMVIHTAKNLATWLRFCIVITVWLGSLPYIIRQIWRLLFWFSDGGWPTNAVLHLDQNSTGMDVLRGLQLASLAENGTSPVSPLQASPTTSASIAGMVDILMGLVTPVSQTLNISSADPLAAGLFKSLAYGFGLQPMTADSGNLQHLGDVSMTPRYSSLLSEVTFLRNLTRHPSINQLVITIAEGYIITILVVVCFILVFLIREWVVQQQPGINMGAGFNAEFAAAERPREQPANEVVPNLPAGEERQQEQREPAPRPMARVRRRNNHQGQGDATREQHNQLNPDEVEGNRLDTGSSSNRPVSVRDALSPAAEIQRVLTEEPRMTEEFLAIWRRADSDPREVLRIIERENKGDQMRYWVNAMRILQNPSSQTHEPGPRVPTQLNLPEPEAGAGNTDATKSTSGLPSSTSSNSDSVEVHLGSDESSSSSGSWVDVPEPLNILTNESSNSPHHAPSTTSYPSEGSASEKGKSIALEDAQAPPFSFTDPAESSSPLWSARAANSLVPGTTRPRATSDGPPRRQMIAPLGHNNWSFSNLPLDDDNSSNKENQSPVNLGIRTPSGLTDDTLWANTSCVSSQMSKTLDKQGFSEDKDESGAVVLVEDHFGPGSKSGAGIAVDDGPIEIIGQDGVVRTHQSWDEVFENNPIPDSDSDSDGEAEENPFHPDAPLPQPQEPIVDRPADPQGIFGTVADFLWGGLGADQLQDEAGVNDEHIVEDLAAEAPFVPVVHEPPLQPAGNLGEQDREVAEAAIVADLDPNDPDAIDDAEDFEGIMELVGMRGPIFSLFQNALFSAFLLALTVAFGVWIPYNIGRVSLLLLANPGPAFKLPLKLIFGCAAFMQDMGLTLAGLLSYCLVGVLSLPINIWSSYSTGTTSTIALGGIKLGPAALNISHGAFDRILDGTLSSIIHITDSEIFTFSAASHESLIMLRSLVIDNLANIGSTVRYIFQGNHSITLDDVGGVALQSFRSAWQLGAAIPSFLARPESWVISLEVGKRPSPLDLELSVWDGTDRFWAIVTGYTVLCLLGALYVKKGTPFSSGQVGREWEATIIDLLNQAGGVMKVILIISIEMLVFPLYCGLLLDAALLPLFENTTIMSRLLFTFKSPLTSIFVHWFVGTCYMFHFALFVSMCRKIMRKGVLYFIRDPDDPTFHPVRDVLERNVATQLRKILFSALVYGGLVVVCLGGVVWGLAYAFKGVLPIHWSSNEPVLEFPIDLLFYNFLMPLAVKFFKPSDGLHAMYTWWFRQCARMLRLTWFMFDERKLDEEGHNVRRTWGDVFRGVAGDPEKKLKTDDSNKPFIDNPSLRAYFRQDGHYVRAPASDQVRIPKGTQIFLEVDENNHRMDKKRDRTDGVHGSRNELYKQVYIPPWFQARIFLFILSIWLFAALTGVSITIVPLVFGRHIFTRIIPPHVRKNDVYAFSIGIYILGSALYAILHLGKFFTYLKNALAINADTPHNILRWATAIGSRAARIGWTYAAFLFILPTLFAFVIEMYFITPLHTYFAVEERHVVHFVQSWTLGLLYVKLTTRLILWNRESRPAQSLRAITRDGYLNPDARLATRSFILPVGLILSVALFYPWCLAKMTVVTLLKNNPEKHLLAYRYAYPMCLCLGCIAFAMYTLLGWVKDWRMKIRDEVYLIGERLHNFGDRKTSSNGPTVPTVRRLDT